MFKRDELLQLDNLDHRTNYINMIIRQLLDGYIPTEVEAMLLRGYAAEYVNAIRGRSGVKALKTVVLEIGKIVSGKSKVGDETLRL